MSLTREKLNQAVKFVQEADLDIWLTFVRETAGGSDPVLPLLIEGGLTWHSALMVTRGGDKIAVVGNYDADPLVASGDWDKVIPYVQGMKENLLEVFEEYCRPTPRIGLNFSSDDTKADGLTHGMFLTLQDWVRDSRFEGAFVSAAGLLSKLRGIKTKSELERIEGAILAGDLIFKEIAEFAKVGVSERAVYDIVHRWMRERGLGFSWDPAGDPIVNSGPHSMIGHGVPSDKIIIEPGHIFHVDLGVIWLGYSSDVQRCWYVGDEVPEDVQKGLDAVNAAISAGAELLRPGVLGHEVDAAARATIQERGYPEYLHAFGHQVGLVAHDGGAILGPEWDRYGDTPRIPICEGEIYTLELGVTLPERGYLGLEEMVVVTAEGCEFLTTRQMTMPLIRP
jgi:Xaa-Pro aminopeptidase